LIILWSSPSSPWSSLGSTTWHGTYHFMSTHLAQWVVPKFHQLSKTKLGLSTGPWPLATSRNGLLARSTSLEIGYSYRQFSF
jgi:hypothetical protein